jgi:bifunctional DNA-binding transcriptional regulator/antitoxin component of YhaV-PrlF toxin-antitoxin module
LTVRHFTITLLRITHHNECEDAMTTLTVTARGQVTFRKDVLQHLGIKPGDQIDFDKLPGGELRVRVAHKTGNIKGFIGLLAGSASKVMSIEEMNEIAAAGWAGEK